MNNGTCICKSEDWVCLTCVHHVIGHCTCLPVVKSSDSTECTGVEYCGYHTPQFTTIYVVFDGRSCGGAGIERATALFVSSSLKEARQNAHDLRLGQSACYELVSEFGVVVKHTWLEDFD